MNRSSTYYKQVQLVMQQAKWVVQIGDLRVEQIEHGYYLVS